LNNKPKSGATGTFPKGKPLRTDDLGGLNAVLCLDREKKMLFLDFTRPVHWLAISPENAKDMAIELFRLAQEAERLP
jgi:hypothetical protein